MKSPNTRKFIIVNSFLFLLLLLAFYFDKQVVYIISLTRNAVLTDFFMGVAFISSLLVIFVFLTLLFIQNHKRKWIIPLWATLIVDVIIGFLLKIMIQRSRPFELGLISLIEGLEKSSYYLWNFSFPSFQALMIFSAIPFLSKEFPKFKYVWIVFACVVALSRVYLGVHFLSDVIAGALIGYFIGYVVVKKVERKW